MGKIMTADEFRTLGNNVDICVIAEDIAAINGVLGGDGGGNVSKLTELTAFNKNFGTGAGDVCEGNDSRLSDSRTPTAHASSHASGGSDAVKLDDLAAPDDNTDLDASTSAHGLLPKLGGGTTNFLRADGTWANPADGTGDVDGPASAVDQQLAVFDGTTGKLIKAIASLLIDANGNLKLPGGVIVGDEQTAASADLEGCHRYYSSTNDSYVDVCMKTGASTYAWVNTIHMTW